MKSGVSKRAAKGERYRLQDAKRRRRPTPKD
jgi:hypothetical protein